MNINEYNEYKKFEEKLAYNFKLKFQNEITSTAEENKVTKFSNIVFLCIGTDRIKGDSIGPIIGSKIKKMENEYIKIYGTLEKNLDFSNAKHVIDEVYNIYNNPFIITIDAALCKENKVGKIYLNSGHIKIGKALDKSISFYSNINIKCIVGIYNETQTINNIDILKNANIDNIIKMSDIVSKGIVNIIKNIYVYV